MLLLRSTSTNSTRDVGTFCFPSSPPDDGRDQCGLGRQQPARVVSLMSLLTEWNGLGGIVRNRRCSRPEATAAIAETLSSQRPCSASTATLKTATATTSGSAGGGDEVIRHRSSLLPAGAPCLSDTLRLQKHGPPDVTLVVEWSGASAGAGSDLRSEPDPVDDGVAAHGDVAGPGRRTRRAVVFRIEAHKEVLTAKSEYFTSMFSSSAAGVAAAESPHRRGSGGFREAGEEEVMLLDFRPACQCRVRGRGLGGGGGVGSGGGSGNGGSYCCWACEWTWPELVCLVIRYLYFGLEGCPRISISSSNVLALLLVSNYFQVEELQDHCCGFVAARLDKHNAVAAHLAALANGPGRLQVLTETFIVRHFQAILAATSTSGLGSCCCWRWRRKWGSSTSAAAVTMASSDEDPTTSLRPSSSSSASKSSSSTTSLDMTSLTAGQLERILSRPDLVADSEVAVFKLVLRWACKDPAARTPQLPPLLACINYTMMGKAEIEECFRATGASGTSGAARRRSPLSANHHHHHHQDLPAPSSSWWPGGRLPWRWWTKDQPEAASPRGPEETLDKVDHPPRHLPLSLLEAGLRESQNYLGLSPQGKLAYWAERPRHRRWPKVMVVVRMYWKKLPLEWYDFKADRWNRLAEVPQWRSCTTVVAHCNTIFLIGGEEKDPNSPTGSRTVNRVTEFNCDTLEWTAGFSMLLARRWAGAVVAGDTVYVIGGIGGKGGTFEKRLSSVECCQLGSNRLQVENKANKENKASNAANCKANVANNVQDHGCSKKNDGGSRSCRTSRWRMLAPMSTPRSSHSVEYLDGKIYVVGGGDGQDLLNSAEVYNVKRNEWSRLPDLKTRRWKCGLVAMEGAIYAVGGMFSEKAGLWGEPLSSVERYDPRSNCWTEVAPMIHARFGCAVVAHCGKIYATGGFGEDKAIMKSSECYDPKANLWTSVSPMKKMCGFVAGALIDRPIHPDRNHQ